METTAEVSDVVRNLGTSVWAFSALSSAVEAGLLDYLTEPRTSSYIGEQTGTPAALVERVLDIMAALGLVRREGDVFASEPGLLPSLQSPAKQYLLADVRTTYLQAWHLIDSAKRHSVALGWHFTDPETLNVMGLFSAREADGMAGRLTQALEGLAERMQAPSPAFLDVGSGVGAISIVLCRHFPNLRVVGLEPADAPLAEARRNIAAAGLGNRTELRRQRVEEMTDSEEFDLAYFPQMFMADEVFEPGLRALWTALRPGGWLMTGTFSLPGAELEPAVGRLRDTLFGGGGRPAEEVAAKMTDAGFGAVRVIVPPGKGTMRVVLGRRPI